MYVKKGFFVSFVQDESWLKNKRVDIWNERLDYILDDVFGTFFFCLETQTQTINPALLIRVAFSPPPPQLLHAMPPTPRADFLLSLISKEK